MTVRGFIRILWRQKWVIVATLAVVVTGAVAYQATIRRVYSSSVTVGVDSVLVDGDKTTGAPGVRVDPLIVTDPVVVSAAADALGAPPEAVAGKVGSTANAPGAMVVTAVGTSPDEAQGLANAFAAAAADHLRADVTAYIATLQENVDRTAAQLAALPTFATEETPSPLILAQRGIYQEQYTAAFTRVTEAQAVTNPVTISGPAPPGTLSSLSPQTTLEVALLAGLIAGIGLALLRHWLDGRVIDAADAAVATDLPVVGAIPVDPIVAKTGRPTLIAASGSTAPVAEDIRRMRTAVTSSLELGEGSVVVVTGVVEGDGASFVAANLAAASARAGRTTVVASGDLRAPNLSHFFGIVSGDDSSAAQRTVGSRRRRSGQVERSASEQPEMVMSETIDIESGTTSLNGSATRRAIGMRSRATAASGSLDRGDALPITLADTAPQLSSLSRPTPSVGRSPRLVATVVDGLSLLPSLVGPGADVDALASERVRAMIGSLRTRADLVVLDAPALLEFGDALTLAEYADALLIVVRSRRTRTRDLSRAVGMLSTVGLKGTKAGVVVNRIRRSRWARGGGTAVPPRGGRRRRTPRDDD